MVPAKMPSSVRPVVPTSAVELVTAEIRRSILTGALLPGASFSVSTLASELGVSHVPVREALQRLSAQGLVVLTPARSAVVAPLSVEDLDGIYRLRLLLEPELASLAAPLHTDSELARLEQLWSSAYGESSWSDSEWSSHSDFHRVLIEPAASAWDLRFLDQLWHAAERYVRLVFDPQDAQESDLRERADIHRVILDSALNRHSNGVKSTLYRHLNDNHQRIRGALVKLTKR